MKTSSLWGTPPARYYRFLRQVEQEATGPVRFAVLGCSDGKFVVPAARRGFNVLAVEVDRVALFGGEKQGPGGIVQMPGLVERLRLEGLLAAVEVVAGNFFSSRTFRGYDALFTSGSIQYSRNQGYGAQAVANVFKRYLRVGGLVYLDYMLPMESKHAKRRNYISRDQWDRELQRTGFEILHNRVLRPLRERAHVDKPVDHFHHWGHLLARRRR